MTYLKTSLIQDYNIKTSKTRKLSIAMFLQLWDKKSML